MPHIHTEPDQHDMTVSAYIIRRENDVWKCLVHFHIKIEKLMQIGGHIELNETPWQSVAHEIEEESGYELEQLQVLQPTKRRVTEVGNISHPVPFSMNTHNVGDDHYHSDICFGFVATDIPQNMPAGGESVDLRWLSLDELAEAVKSGEALQDMYHIYEFLIGQIDSLLPIATNEFSLKKPGDTNIVYKHGRPRE